DGAAVYTPGISERRSGVSKWSHQDYLGSTKALTNSSETVTDTRQYDAFGLQTGSTGSNPTPFGFAGGWGYQSDETGLQLLGHRYYDPSTGRFLTRDPVQDGRNWYGYCDNNPIKSVDPEGLQTVPSRDSVTANFATLKELIREGVIAGKEFLATVRGQVIKYLEKYGIKITEHGVQRALERLDQIQDLVDILRTGGGYYDPVTDTNIVYSNKYKQGVVLDRKTGKVITVLSKAPKSRRWIAIGRAAINAILKK
ncbi:MAG TPA: RHS repeat-associated core domain-containing protein, partial [Fimbriimonadaceae bacterium]|nr:RHS repeat-associated core domain-containing protein [Fimbriimonadaceae bacterium]